MEPDGHEYADVLDEEIERIGTRSDALARRIVQRRFTDPQNSKLTWTFRELLDRSQIDSPDALLAFLGKHLDVVWME